MRNRACRISDGLDMVSISQEQEAGATGVDAIAIIIRDELGWVYRRQIESDYGIDAHTEVVQNGKVTGKLFALQVKAGSSFFRERDGEDFVLRVSKDLADYWLAYSLPVVVVLYDPNERKSFWQPVTKETVQYLRRGAKVIVPHLNILSRESRAFLSQVVEGPVSTRRLGKLQSERSLMEHAMGGWTLYLEIDEWINKLSRRADFTFFAESETREQTELASWTMLHFDGAPTISALFPWADIDRDGVLYEDCDTSDPEYLTYYDEETGALAYYHPYQFIANEIAQWRLILTLNDLGRAFLKVSKYLDSGELEDS